MTTLIAVPVSADISDDQFIAVGTGPLWWEGLGITQAGSACDPEGDLQGVDGYWYDLEAHGVSGAGFEFLLTTEDPMDVDAVFYDDGCGLLEEVGACFIGPLEEPPLCQQESGPVPDGAAYLLIQNFAGSGTYQLTVS